MLNILRHTATRPIALMAMAAMLTACGNIEPDLVRLRSDDTGPEEFSIAPLNPLAEPENYADLPTPKIAARNRAEIDARGTAVAALGGRPDAATGADTGLLAYAARFGSDPEIRRELGETDEAYRRRVYRFSRFQFFERNKYDKAYAREILNADAEALYWAKRGAQVPKPRQPLSQDAIP